MARARIGLLVVLIALGMGIGVAGMRSFWPRLQPAPAASDVAALAPAEPSLPGVDPRLEQAQMQILGLAAVADQVARETGAAPTDPNALYAAWRAANPGAPDPLDPYDAQWYGYQVEGVEFVIWSRGPDAQSRDDDLYYSSVQAKAAAQ